MFLFKKKPKSYLGIDIGASAAKLVELEKKENRYQLKNYAIFSFNRRLERDSSLADSESFKIPDNEEMAKIIKKTIKEAKIDSRETYLSVPVYFSFSTLIDFPISMSEKEIAAAIPFSAKKYVPVPITEVVLDWSVVSSINSREVQQVLLIAVPKEVINNYSQIVRLAGLNLKSIEEETFSLSRVLIGNDKSAILLIDGGARSVNVSVVDDGYIRLTHNLEMGGMKITKAISQQMNFDFEKAEELKKKISETNGQLANERFLQLKAIINSSLGAIIVEIKKIVETYQNRYNRRIEKVILVGSGVHLFGFADDLTNSLAIEVSLGDPFARILYPPLLKPVLKEIGSSLSVAVGLAMRK